MNWNGMNLDAQENKRKLLPNKARLITQKQGMRWLLSIIQDMVYAQYNSSLTICHIILPAILLLSMILQFWFVLLIVNLVYNNQQSYSALLGFSEDYIDIYGFQNGQLPPGLFTHRSIEEIPNDSREQEHLETVPDTEDDKDVLLVFEKEKDIRFIWDKNDFDLIRPEYEWRTIPCNRHGVKSCTVSLLSENLSKADAIIHLAPLTAERGLTVPLTPKQAFVGFFTEMDDNGCRQPAYDAKLSYSSDATIRFNDNCNTVKKMYNCMSRALRIIEDKKITIQTEINRTKRMVMKYCMIKKKHEDFTEAEYDKYVHNKEGDVAIFVSNCSPPRSNFIKELVRRSPDRIVTHSYGRCYNNHENHIDKIGQGHFYKFLFSIENKIKRDYVTEKAFHAYWAGVIPIYQGAPNLFEYLPRGSLIGLNTFATPKELADYIEYLSKNETAYDEFFNWDLEDWAKQRHTRECLKVETSVAFDAGFCSTCDWLVNIYPKWKANGKKNCDKNPHLPYFGYPRDSDIRISPNIGPVDIAKQ